ncbi:uncharacterized protein LY89DRAFT_54114 [Mollisia scopiformis]|uniref:Uncharacterized protein n=1 Tax=Mollisia scopiformis TaxID=149040 RepID=A0A194XBD1_MOLSC|nr:uncharacterized protein LY89DRAFT_54114 [Mollisia scopiformis]KUJ17468.1 hypothetical protein LY89DRAFT_54114 [Mollisia scopiformis]
MGGGSCYGTDCGGFPVTTHRAGLIIGLSVGLGWILLVFLSSCLFSVSRAANYAITKEIAVLILLILGFPFFLGRLGFRPCIDHYKMDWFKKIGRWFDEKNIEAWKTLLEAGRQGGGFAGW